MSANGLRCTLLLLAQDIADADAFANPSITSAVQSAAVKTAKFSSVTLTALLCSTRAKKSTETLMFPFSSSSTL